MKPKRDPATGRFPGTNAKGQTLVYMTQDAGLLCVGCANRENGSIASTKHTTCPDEYQWWIRHVEVHTEPYWITCDHCGAQIKPATPAAPSW